MASKEDGPSHVRSLQGSFDDLGLESYICRCYRGPVVRQLTHEGSFPLFPQRAFPNREVIKELSTTLRFTSSGVLPPFLPGACYPNALLRHSSYSEPAGYREVETCPSPLGPVRTWQCSPTCLCSLKTSISRHKHRKQNSEGDTGRRGEGGALEGEEKPFFLLHPNSLRLTSPSVQVSDLTTFSFPELPLAAVFSRMTSCL